MRERKRTVLECFSGLKNVENAHGLLMKPNRTARNSTLLGMFALERIAESVNVRASKMKYQL